MRFAYLCTDPGIPVNGVKGASIHVRSMAEALESLGHELRIFTPRRGREDVGGSLEIEEWPVGRTVGRLAPIGPATAASRGARREQQQIAYNYAAVLKGREVLSAYQPDAIYERYALFGTAGQQLARLLGVPHLLEVNAPLCDEQAEHRQLHYERVARRYERRVLLSADQVFVVSEPLSHWATRMGVAAERLTVMPNAVDPARFKPELRAARALRRGLGIPDPACVVGFCGSLKPWHDLDSLVEAYARLRSALPHSMFRLLVIGDGPGMEVLVARANALGVSSELVLAGALPHAEIPPYVAAMDIAVAPYPQQATSYFSPLKLFEYMAAGRAVIAAGSAPVAAVLDDPGLGMTYPPGDVASLTLSLIELARDAGLRRRLGKAARERVLERHTWQHNAMGVAAAARLRAAQVREALSC